MESGQKSIDQRKAEYILNRALKWGGNGVKIGVVGALALFFIVLAFKLNVLLGFMAIIIFAFSAFGLIGGVISANEDIIEKNIRFD